MASIAVYVCLPGRVGSPKIKASRSLQSKNIAAVQHSPRIEWGNLFDMAIVLFGLVDPGQQWEKRDPF